MVGINIRIGTRLSLGFGLMILLTLTLGTISYLGIQKIWNNFNEFYEHPLPTSKASRELLTQVTDMRRLVKEVVLSDSEVEIEAYIQQIDATENKVYQNFSRIDEQFSGDRASVTLAKQHFADWKPIRDEIILLTRKKDVAAAIELIRGKGSDHLDRLMNQVNVIVDFSITKEKEFFADAQSAETRTIRVVLVLLFITLLQSLILSVLITRSIILPLNLIVDKIRAVAKGKITEDLNYYRKDELGTLADSFREMTANLRNKAHVANAIAMGNFEKEIKLAGPDDDVAISINKISQNFKSIVQQAQVIGEGDFRQTVNVNSDHDTLGIALQTMVGSLRSVVKQARLIADGRFAENVIPRSENDELSHTLNRMNNSLREMKRTSDEQNQLKTAQNELSGLIQGELNIQELAEKALPFIAKFTESRVGAFYGYNLNDKAYLLTAGYAISSNKNHIQSFKLGEGLLGQVAQDHELVVLENIPNDYFHVKSSLGEARPESLMIVPLVHEGACLGVVELAGLTEYSVLSINFVKAIQTIMAVAIHSAINRIRLNALLQKSRNQSEELQTQQEELRQANLELEEQAKALRMSEGKLKLQQEELTVTNEELREKNDWLEKQKAENEIKNQELEIARKTVEQKASELEITSKYKSEFLANMSHELRTPLNSLLILSQTLMENKDGNLSGKQIEAATIIYRSGNDLLNLINEVLDLSKVEAGKMDVHPENVLLKDIISGLKDSFRHMAEEKGLSFEIADAKDAPEQIVTDTNRLQQILRNLISNAIKFTEKGKVLIKIEKYNPSSDDSGMFDGSGDYCIIRVKDTGTGIPKKKLQEIFEAFQQLDGSISRKYGGTGLGLSISRELAKLLKGRITVSSEEGKGSEFSIILPYQFPKQKEEIIVAKPKIAKKRGIKAQNEKSLLKMKGIIDDRELLEDDEKVILIVEDDLSFAKVLFDYCHEKKFKCIHAPNGELAMQHIEEYGVQAIILDLNLPGMNGWEVLSQLKNSTDYRHIPVHIMSAHEELSDALPKGAIGYLSKPVNKEELSDAFAEINHFINDEVRNLLVVEDNKILRDEIVKLIDSKDIQITDTSTGGDAIKMIAKNRYDCVVLDLGLPDMSGFELLKILEQENKRIPPIIVYTGRDITPEENMMLQKHTHSVIIKGVKSRDRLLDETALFLHRVIKKMPERHKEILASLYDKDSIFSGKRILIVDDDMRNVFALTQVFEQVKIQVFIAENGQKAVDKINHQEVDLVLMDIMMPVMDGYETMRKIRSNPRFQKLPIIALTAKAMKEDREKCLQAGANDYLSKPVNVDKLFNLMRVWLYH